MTLRNYIKVKLTFKFSLIGTWNLENFGTWELILRTPITFSSMMPFWPTMSFCLMMTCGQWCPFGPCRINSSTSPVFQIILSEYYLQTQTGHSRIYNFYSIHLFLNVNNTILVSRTDRSSHAKVTFPLLLVQQSVHWLVFVMPFLIFRLMVTFV